MTRKLGFVTAAVAILILPGLVAAQMMEEHGGHGMPPFPLFLRAAQLSPDQQKQVHKILEDNHTAFHKLSEEMHAARDRLAAKLLSTGPVSQNDLAPEVQQINQAHQQLLAQELKVAMQIRAVLKPDQLQRVAKFHQQMQSLHEQMRALTESTGGSGEHDSPPDGPPM